MAQIAANLQRIKNGQRRYAITPRVPAGFIQPDQLQKYIDVAPRDTFKDIFDAIDAFVYFENRKK